MKIIVTGGCCFIGCNFIRQAINSKAINILNIDSLSYAGNIENLLLEVHYQSPNAKSLVKVRFDLAMSILSGS